MKTWERLNRISWEIANTPPVTNYRCTEEHFIELSRHIKKHHPKDKNLPRKITTISQYFHMFSDTCLQVGVSENIAVEEVIDVPEMGFMTHDDEFDIANALKSLDSTTLACLDIEFGTSLSPITYTSKQAFLDATGISEIEYSEILEQALENALPLVQGLAGYRLETDDE